ncbi:hypothetical protein OIU84_008514 [Salix udensis]|uniref:HP domain-containing protein n=1 Tax=Salix udensis TaxID=889485 RepID=A0AAD6JQ05_9ROSI|nr:hypothetical protein OIU84_008514 [Salix udensis]
MVEAKLQVWSVNAQEKVLIPASDQSKFYSGGCYIFQYSYPGEDREEYLIGTWFGKKSVEYILKRMNSQRTHTRRKAFHYSGFRVLDLIICKFYKLNHIKHLGYNLEFAHELHVAPSLNSSYCYILHNDSSVFTWTGNLTTSEDQELMERQLDLIKPNTQLKPQKEGKVKAIHTCSHAYSQKVSEIYNFTHDDLMTGDSFILDSHSEIFAWVGQQKPKRRTPVSHGGRSPAANFENPSATNLSTPPPVVRMVYPKSVSPDSAKLASKSAAIAALTTSFKQPPPARQVVIMTRSVKASPETPKSTPESNSKENSMSSRIESLTIQEDVKEDEAEDEEGLPIYPYGKATGFDKAKYAVETTKGRKMTAVVLRFVKLLFMYCKRNLKTYLSAVEFREKFGMAKDVFYKLPKWKQNKLQNGPSTVLSLPRTSAFPLAPAGEIAEDKLGFSRI